LKKFKTIATVTNGQVVTLWLARPETHTSINDVMISEITTFFTELEEEDNLGIVVIRGEGKSFCSGADLAWMRKSFTLTDQDNLKECEALSVMFKSIYQCTKMVIAAVHGNVFGGGVGLVAVCDLAYCVSNCRFSLSETRIGMAAASITPYLLQKIRPADLKELIFTAKSFDGEVAVRYGIINQTLKDQEALDLYVNKMASTILANGKQAVTESKKLINRLSTKMMSE
jgi:methylglutaconyl-CoA hydratase